jgi:hypothetical protein
MNLPSREPSGDSEIADAGWNSGTMGNDDHGYSPHAVVVHVQRLLRKSGHDVVLTRGMLDTAKVAASDLLRALGVTPQSAPKAGDN